MSSLPPPPPPSDLPPPPGAGASAPNPAPPPPVDPTTPKARSGTKWLLIGTAVLAIALLAVAAIESADNTPEAQMVDPLPAAAPTTSEVEAVSASNEADEADEADDLSSCTWIGDEVTIALVNNSSQTSTYWVTTAYLDADGRRIADEIHFVNAVRPNETAFEANPSLEQATPECAVIDVQRWAAESDPAEMNEIGACQIETPDVFGHASGRLTATNGSAKISDYMVRVAFVNAGGFRIGSGTAIIESVRPGASAPGDVFSFAAAEGIARCDVVAVERTASR